jgi:hypothetical protein
LYPRGGSQSAVAEYEELFGEEQVRFRFRSVALARLSAEECVGASPLFVVCNEERDMDGGGFSPRRPGGAQSRAD